MRDKKPIYLHRFIYEQCFGSIPEGLCVMHKCDNKLCINPEHLELGTLAQNTQDEWSRGLAAKGEALPQHKLTIKDVREIRKSSLPQKKLAQRYGVTHGCIHWVIKRRNWAWVS